MPQQPSDTSGWTPVDESTSAWTPVDEPAPSQPSALYRGLKGVAEGVIGGLSALPAASQALQNPTSLVGPAIQTVLNAQQTQSKPGRYAQYAAAAVPMIGPAVAQQGQMIAQGNIAEPVGQVIGGMLVPGGAKAIKEAPGVASELISRHPFATEAMGRTAGAVGGAAIGPVIAHGAPASEVGALGGAYLGQRLGGDLAKAAVKAADAKVIQDVVTGKRDPLSIPARLQPTLKNILKAQESAYADIAARQGLKPEQMDIPTGLREGVKKLYEERARESASLPSLIQTPEQLATQAQRAKAFGAQSSEMRPEASARGMAYAAGRHQTEWVPSKRGTEVSRTETFRRSPKIKEIQPPPK